ncbi:hypothetical protein HU200_055827 [Digitaria exilis]|uniref:Auxin-responsive protein n=1 Tax=Digitaria exilis TaxID=1010633 RepID=A0A835ADZ8_9POAL|nr:hypothetical protein HU200_055827 [Digitaria exilis]
MAWRGRLGEAGDSGLELSLGLPAYFAKQPSVAPSFDLDVKIFSPCAQRVWTPARCRVTLLLWLSKLPKGATAQRQGWVLSDRRALISLVRPPAAAPVVGWPPVRSFRRNLASSSRQSPQSSSAHHHDAGVKGATAAKGGAAAGEGLHKGPGLFVKINMDGVPIGRKVDLRAYGGYVELSAAVGKLFRGLLAAQRDPGAAAVSRRGGEEAEEPVIGGEYTLVYEDEEGDRDVRGHREEAARAQELRPDAIIGEFHHIPSGISAPHSFLFNL